MANDRQTLSIIRDAGGRPLAFRNPVFLLRVLRGPSRRREERFAQRRVLIGSGPTAQLRLDDDAVSAVHCELLVDESGIRVRDLGAKNGVWLEGRRIAEAWLSSKDELELGETTLRFTLAEASEDQPVGELTAFGGLIGGSVVMREVFRHLQLAARSPVPIHLHGETGTGKALAAEALIAAGDRPGGPVQLVECGALAAALAESELFGHEAGAFTGATRLHPGAFERANGGTLVLDDVSELPLELQGKLLGALDRRQVQRLGGSAPVDLDVRVLSTSQRELEREVNRGVFRADLYYRLCGVTVRLPALREHPEDIPALVAHYLAQGSAPPPAGPVLQRLYEADYPGNVRQLFAAVERALLGVWDGLAPAPARTWEVDLGAPYRPQKDRVVESFERAYLTQMLRACRWNVSEAARRSGINRVHLHAMISRLGLTPDEP